MPTFMGFITLIYWKLLLNLLLLNLYGSFSKVHGRYNVCLWHLRMVLQLACSGQPVTRCTLWKYDSCLNNLHLHERISLGIFFLFGLIKPNIIINMFMGVSQVVLVAYCCCNIYILLFIYFYFLPTHLCFCVAALMSISEVVNEPDFFSWTFLLTFLAIRNKQFSQT